MNTELINKIYEIIADEDEAGKCTVDASFLLDICNELEKLSKS